MKKAIVSSIIFLILISNIFPRQPYVILVSFDGFRWDYLNRDITPNLNRICEEGVHSTYLTPCFPTKTFPNHIAILTGMYPENHGIISNRFENPFTGNEYRIGNNESVKNPEWYMGEFFWETARRNGIRTASYFWPGSEIGIESRRPDIYKQYEHNKPYTERIDSVVKWLQRPYNERPRFITIYFHDTDSYGHDYGPESPEINESISRVDSLAGYLIDELKTIGLKDSVNLIFLSDHGMTPTSAERIINITDLLGDLPAKITDSGTFCMIQPEEGYIDTVYNRLKSRERHYKVYKKENIPDYLHYSKHPFIRDILMIADLGWLIETDSAIKRGEKSGYSRSGNHGYPNYHLDMQSLFVAYGPVFRKGLRVPSLFNIDIYPLLCEIYGISPRENIDGSIERIKHILE